MSVSEDIKTKIRSVLLSKVGGILLSELNRDYKKLVGQPIMYRKLGFSTLENMIISIPDVARIKASPDGDRVYGILNNPNIMNHTARKAQYRPDVGDDMPELLQQSDTLKWQTELQPNLKGLYCLCMPKQSALSREIVDKEFSQYGDVKETSYTERYVFVRFGRKEHALAALEGLSQKYDVRIPTEKNNPSFHSLLRVFNDNVRLPFVFASAMLAGAMSASSRRRVIKEKDVNGEMPPYPVVKRNDDRIVKSADSKSQLEVFVGNLPSSTQQAELEMLVSEFKVLNVRVRGGDGKRFGFVLVPDQTECEKIVKKLHRVMFKDRLLIAQASYQTAEKRTPQENKVILQNFVKGGLKGTMAVAKTGEDEEVEELEHNQGTSHDNPNHVTVNNNNNIYLKPIEPVQNLSPTSEPQRNKQNGGIAKRKNYQSHPSNLPELERCEMPTPADSLASFNSPERHPNQETIHSIDSLMASTPGLEPISPQRENYQGKKFNQRGNSMNQGNFSNWRNYTNHTLPWAGKQPNGYSAGIGQTPHYQIDERSPDSQYQQYHGRERNTHTNRTDWESRVRPEEDHSIAELVSQIELGDQGQRHNKHVKPIVLGSEMGDLHDEERTFDLYCSNFPCGTLPEELFMIFEPYGASHVKMKSNERGKKTYAFIVFTNYEDATEAFTNLDGQVFNGREIAVNFGRKCVIDDRDLAKKMGNLKCTVTIDHGEEKRSVKLETSRKHPKSSPEIHSTQQRGYVFQHNPQVSQQHSRKSTDPRTRQQFSERLDAGDGPIQGSQVLNPDHQRHSVSPQRFKTEGQSVEAGMSDNREQKKSRLSRDGWGGGGGDNRGQRNGGAGLGRGSLISSLKQQPATTKPERRRSRNDSWETVSDGSGPSLSERLSELTPPALAENPCNPLATIPQQEETPVPSSMRRDRLDQIYRDCFPGVGCRDLNQLEGKLCVFPRVEESSGYFWGQLMSENMSAALELALQIAELESRSCLALYQGKSKRAGALYAGEWYRVWVEDLVADVARVFFVDWGNMETLPISDFRELPEEFWRCQPLALPFKLNGHDNVGELLEQQVGVQFISCQDPQNVVQVKYLESHVLQG